MLTLTPQTGPDSRFNMVNSPKRQNMPIKKSIEDLWNINGRKHLVHSYNSIYLIGMFK